MTETRTGTKFDLSAAFDRPFFWTGGGSVRFLVARLSAQAARAEGRAERAPLNIGLVIDASGSMAGGKLEAAKQAALGLAERLTERDRLTLVSFASEALIHLDAVPVTEDGMVEIRRQIGALRPRDLTDLSGGWFAGVECTARLAEEQPALQPRIILLSDGHANRGIFDPDALHAHARELRARGVLTSALGIGDGYDEHLLRGIAENGGGRLHDAEHTEEIDKVLLGELAEMEGTAVENAVLSLVLPQGVEVHALGRASVTRHQGRLEVALGPVPHGAARVVVFKVRCPSAQPGEVLAFEASATGRAAGGADLHAGPVSATLTAADGNANAAQARDEELAAVVARAWSAEVVLTASRLNRDGAFAEVADYVDRELRFFRRYVQGLAAGPSLMRDLKLLGRRASARLSPRMQKEMMLQSLLVLEQRRDWRGPLKGHWRERLEQGE